MPSVEEEETEDRVSTRATSKKNPFATNQTSTSAAFDMVSSLTTGSRNKRKIRIPKSNDSVPSKSQGSAGDATPYNPSFDSQVLDPRHIKIEKVDGCYTSASTHFDVTSLPSTQPRRLYYTEKREVADSSEWVENDECSAAEIARDYEVMCRRGLCEEEFASYAKETLLKRDRLLNDGAEKVRSWRTQRMLQLIAKPKKDTHWEAPPLIDEPPSALDQAASDYTFDLRPDCSYWLSLQAFNADYQSHIECWAHLMYRELAFPYFTVEFKKDNYAEGGCKSQVAAAASVALYNRYLLRLVRLEKQKLPWTKKLIKVPRHYGLTVKGDEYTIWSITPTLSGYQWAGCSMEAIGHGYCTRAPDVHGLIDWINEIHCWGLTSHGPRCENDVKYSMQAVAKKKGFRPSEVSPDSEDGSDSEGESEADEAG